MIELGHSYNLATAEVGEWFKSGAPGTFKEPVVETPEMSGKALEAGSARLVSGQATIRHLTAKRKNFNVIKHEVAPPPSGARSSRVIGQFSIVVPLHYALRVELESSLYLASTGLSGQQRQAIIDAYQAFTPGTDAVTYMVDKARQAGVGLDQFHVPVRTLLTAIGQPTEDLEQVRKMEDIYADGATVNGNAEWFSRNRIEAVEVLPEELLPAFENPPPPPKGMVVVQGPSQTATEALEADLKNQGFPKLDCDAEYKYENQEVMTVMTWPEFRVVWLPNDVRIGCATVRLWLPSLQRRTTDSVLYAVYAYPVNPVDYRLMNDLKVCGRAAAFSGAVVGVVMWNPGLAWTAFVAAFELCMFMKVGEHLTCLMPGLKVVDRIDDWA